MCASLVVPPGAIACPADALGTSRTLILQRESSAYGRAQHGPLPLQKGEVVLTFDDGPLPGLIERVLETLSNQCVQATFFMTGANLAEHPELGKRVAQAGHTPALHSFAHPSLRQMPPAEQLADLDKGVQAFTRVFGGPPPAYRFPYLEETAPILAALKEKTSRWPRWTQELTTTRQTTCAAPPWSAAWWHGLRRQAAASSSCTTRTRPPWRRCRTCSRPSGTTATRLSTCAGRTRVLR